MVLATALLLVFAIGRLVVGGDDPGSSGDGAVTPAAGEPTSDPSADVRPRRDRGERADAGNRDRGDGKKDQPEPLPEPTGPCADGDVVVTPVVDEAVGGSPVTIGLDLRTMEADACTWTASHRTLTLKITSGHDDIWASRECPHAVPTQAVTVYREHTTTVDATWTAKRSTEETCSRGTEWATPGWYHVAAAALAGEPSDTQFELTVPEGEHITKTVQPKPDKQGDGRD
jgi:hypothetical protein